MCHLTAIDQHVVSARPEFGGLPVARAQVGRIREHLEPGRIEADLTLGGRQPIVRFLPVLRAVGFMPQFDVGDASHR